MARLPRLNLPDIPQHIIQRGNNRHVCFFEENDYVVYLSKLKEYAEKYQVEIHSYVLMTNHVHLRATPRNKTGVSEMMQSLGRYFVRYINKRHGRTGTLWEGRFKSCLVDSDNYFLTVSKYIELNPVRARMVAHPAEYPWSSYRFNALGKNITLITPHDCYFALGRDDVSRRNTYNQLFLIDIPDSTLEEIRNAINKAWALGEDRFIKQIEAQTGRRASALPRGGDRKSKAFQRAHAINLL